MDELKRELMRLLYHAPCRPEMEGEPGSCPYRRDGRCREINKLDICAMGVLVDLLVDNNMLSQRWIPVAERLPEPETEVLILSERKTYSFKGTVTTHYIVTTGMYEDGKQNTEDSEWWWHDHDFKYNEELDAYIIPEGWWEYKHYNGDDKYNHPINDTVTHWMPMPEAPAAAKEN